jgi:hypothetical protein
VRDQRVALVFVAQRQALAQVLRRVAGPDGRELDQDHADAGPHPDARRGARHDLGKEVHVVEGRRAAEQHLGHRQLRAVLDELGAHPALLRRPDMVLQPVHQRQVVGEPAQ